VRECIYVCVYVSVCGRVRILVFAVGFLLLKEVRALRCVAVCCSVLRCVAVCCSVPQRVALRVVVCCSVHSNKGNSGGSVSQRVAVRIAVCCSVLQCVAVFIVTEAI